MKKKILAVALAAIMLVVAVTGATLAYLQDTDYDKNVMTVGNVKIVQNEQQRNEDGTALEDYVDGKLLPAVYVGTLAYDGQVTLDNGNKQVIWDATINNEIDKIVTVTNNGTEDAYVRTIFAFEDKIVNGKYITEQIHTLWNYSASVYAGGVEWVADGDTYPMITIGDTTYTVCVFTYKAEVASLATSDASLVQLFLDPTSDNSFYDEIGDKYDILTLSQAVQVAGFDSAEQALDAAFGEITADTIDTVQQWFVDAQQ